jgi:hypothetical protein
VDVTGGSLEAVGSYPLGRWPVQVIGKLGLLAWDANADTQPGLNDSGSDWLAGIGLRWSPADQWGLQLGYERAGLDVNTLTAGAMLRF